MYILGRMHIYFQNMKHVINKFRAFIHLIKVIQKVGADLYYIDT